MANFSVSKLLAFSALVMVPLAAHASNQTRLPGVVDKELPNVEVPAEHSLDKKPGKALEEAPAVKRTGSTKVVATLKKVIFEGNTVIPESMLQHIASKYLNRALTQDDLAQFKYEVSKLYYDNGYILVKPVTPPQNLASGTMKMTIYEAKIGEVKVYNENVLSPTVLNGFTSRLSGDEVFEESKAESAIRDINDLKGINAAINLQPGGKVGTTDLHLTLEDAPEDEQRITLDNYGSELTGKAVAALHLEKSNLLKLGETFEADVRKSSTDLWSVEGKATVPTAIYNIKGVVDYLHSENEIGDRLAALDASGETDSVSVGLLSDLLNTRRAKVTVQGGLEARDHKSFRSDLIETEDELRKVYLNTAYVWHSGNAVTYAALRASKGLSALGANNKGDPLSTRLAGDPEAWILEPVFVAQYRPVQQGLLKVITSGQYTSDTLLSSDLFVLGGYGSIRGFEPAETTGESGYQFSVEYDHSIDVDPEWSVKAGPFIDGGAVRNELPGQVLDTHLYSAGLGLEIVTQLVPDVNPTSFRFDWAHPIGNYTSTTVDDDTLYMRVSQSF